MNGQQARRPNRLPNYDYAQNGAYFITACTLGRRNIFWEELPSAENVGAHIVRPDLGEPQISRLALRPAAMPPGASLSRQGRAAEEMLRQIPDHYPAVAVDCYAIMPNHVHLLLGIRRGDDGRTLCAPTVSMVVKHWKEAVTKRIGCRIWQKSFYDHVVRNETEYRRIAAYILQNPETWLTDRFWN